VAMVEFLSLKELHRPPPSPRDQTSTQARYLTPTPMPRSGFVLWVFCGPGAIDHLPQPDRRIETTQGGPTVRGCSRG